jgi:hypothetical protein
MPCEPSSLTADTCIATLIERTCEVGFSERCICWRLSLRPLGGHGRYYILSNLRLRFEPAEFAWIDNFPETNSCYAMLERVLPSRP